MVMEQVLQWAAPIASTLIITAVSAQINQRTKRADEKREEARKEAKEQREADKEWRESVDRKLDAMSSQLNDVNDATQATMRTELLHMAEKYITRGWVTPEERASVMDMHGKYAALGPNSYIDGYMERVAQLPDREV